MKWLFVLVLVTVLLSLPLLAMAQQGSARDEKNLCLLSVENCGPRKDTIQEIIAKLKAEIAKGERVYTKQELKRLQSNLEEYEFFYEKLMYGNSSN
jgi:hypothetical protein